jgi:hypothetical protein
VQFSATAAEDEQQQLGAPLLLPPPPRGIGRTGQGDNSGGMTLVTHRQMEHGIVARIVSLPYLVDKLPGPAKIITANGKMAAVGLLALSAILTGLIFPFWALSKFITEIGVYALLCGLVLLIGRGIIRMIAFPGASRKVAGDIEGEFAKYSIRMIDVSCGCLHDIASVLCAEDVNQSTLIQLPQLWGRAQNYRNRILGVFLDVLTYMQEDSNSLVLAETSDVNPPPPGPFGPSFSRFGNNRLTGDIGCFGSLPVSFTALLVIFSAHGSILLHYV